jgi:hypothetical protein
VDDPSSLWFESVEPRCFLLQCGYRGPMKKCARCQMITYCCKVCA